MNDPVRVAADHVSAVFARYPLRAEVVGCPCCVSDADQQGLQAGTPGALDHYALKAMTTWGDADDFRHFLPVLLTMQGGLDDVVTKLHYANWSAWPEDEQTAVREYLTSLWRNAVVTGTGRVPELLDTLNAAGLGIVALLDFVRDQPDDIAAPPIMELVHAVTYESQVRDEKVLRWLQDPRTAQTLEAAFFAAEPAELARRLSVAVDELSWLTG